MVAAVVILGIGPSSDAFSCDKVLLNPYTQSKVLSMEKSYQTYVVTTQWLKTMAEWV